MVVTHNEPSIFSAKCEVKEYGWKFHATSVDERNEMFQCFRLIVITLNILVVLVDII
ncbi:hypothetical protein MKX01_016447 [Papaver californicum]|nr:hypothetical protein MKX01_016447 [Papaver californicum]